MTIAYTFLVEGSPKRNTSLFLLFSYHKTIHTGRSLFVLYSHILINSFAIVFVLPFVLYAGLIFFLNYKLSQQSYDNLTGEKLASVPAE